MSIKRKVKMILAYNGTTTASLANMLNLTDATTRNKLSQPITLSALLQILHELGWHAQLEGPKNVVIPISYLDVLEDQKDFEEGKHREFNPESLKK